jgi:hypothetical protein
MDILSKITGIYKSGDFEVVKMGKSHTVEGGFGMRLTIYGGASFSRHCPNCGRFVCPDKYLSVNRFMNDFLRKIPRTAPADCTRCGVVRVAFAGYGNGS